jgi:hypothetical protein
MQARMVADSANRRSFIGGSDARIIMGNDEAALLRLWREKRGSLEPEDLSNNLIVQRMHPPQAAEPLLLIATGAVGHGSGAMMCGRRFFRD